MEEIKKTATEKTAPDSPITASSEKADSHAPAPPFEENSVFFIFFYSWGVNFRLIPPL